MSVAWGTLKLYIHGLLADPDSTKFPDATLLMWARFACSQIAQHTADAAVATYSGDGTTHQFTLPDDMVENAEKAGLVGISDGADIEYLAPLRTLPGQKWPINIPPTNTAERFRRGFWEWPSGKLSLSFAPTVGETVVLQYFRSWPSPAVDADLLTFPRWMEEPFCYILCAVAMNPKAFTASDIGQWKTKQDSGNPEQNPLIKQAEFYWKSADRILQKNAPQDRESFYGNRDVAWTHQ